MRFLLQSSCMKKKSSTPKNKQAAKTQEGGLCKKIKKKIKCFKIFIFLASKAYYNDPKKRRYDDMTDGKYYFFKCDIKF